MGLRRLRGRLDAVQGDAQGTLAFFRGLGKDLVDEAIELMDALKTKGISLKAEVDEGANIMDFVTGKTKQLPITINVTLKSGPKVDSK